MDKTKIIISVIGLVALAAAAQTAYFFAPKVTAEVEDIESESNSSTSNKPMAVAGPEPAVKGPLTTDTLTHIKLTDQDGQQFSLDELKGETLLVNFMFAGCTTICPAQTYGLRQAHDQMKLDPEKDRIKLISISIAPLSDTPKLLKSYAQRFKIDKPTWRFAVTSQANTDELSEQFGVGVEQPLEGDQLGHRSQLYLINHQGMVIQQYRGDVVNVERLKKELRVVDQIGRT
ncbi:SCO family protein [Leucothrix sargassi]|nr:SCO family protein [Leucothrix sargassi]